MPEGPILLMLKEELQPFKRKKVIAAKGYTAKMDPEILVGKTITDIKPGVSIYSSVSQSLRLGCT